MRRVVRMPLLCHYVSECSNLQQAADDFAQLVKEVVEVGDSAAEFVAVGCFAHRGIVLDVCAGAGFARIWLGSKQTCAVSWFGGWFGRDIDKSRAVESDVAASGFGRGAFAECRHA